MKQRNWFTFHGDHHIGPFSQDEIMTKVMTMELIRDDLIWKEGAPGWLAVDKWPEFSSLFVDVFAQNSNEVETDEVKLNLVFEDPFVEEVNKKDSETKTNDIFEEVQISELPGLPDLPDPPPLPPLPDESIAVSPTETYEKNENEAIGADDESIESNEDKFDFDHTDLQSDTNFQLSHFRFYGSVVIGLIGVVVFVSYLWSALSPTPRAIGLSKANRDAIIHVTQQPFKKKILYKIRPTTDLSSLWLGSNFPYEGWAILRLHSRVGRSMGRTPVELLAQGAYADGLTYFDEIVIVKGEGIIRGEYDYTLELISGEPGLYWNRFLKKIPVIGPLFLTDKPMGAKTLKGTLLLSDLSLKEFNSQLDNYRRNLNHNVFLPLKEQRQRYQTFLGLLKQMEDIYNKTINRINKGRLISLFEKQYNRQIGPMLRDLIIDSNKHHLSTLNINPEVSEGYSALTNFGKEVGELASYMVTETRKVKYLNRASSINIKRKMKGKVEGLLQKGLNHIDEINLQLKKIK